MTKNKKSFLLSKFRVFNSLIKNSIGLDSNTNKVGVCLFKIFSINYLRNLRKIWMILKFLNSKQKLNAQILSKIARIWLMSIKIKITTKPLKNKKNQNLKNIFKINCLKELNPKNWIQTHLLQMILKTPLLKILLELDVA